MELRGVYIWAISIFVTFSVAITPANALCLSSVADLCLNATQIQQTVVEELKRNEIREHYFENVTHYANEIPIIDLTQEQIDAILDNFQGLFSENPPVPPPVRYIYNGTMYEEAVGGPSTAFGSRKRRQVQGDYVCPSTGVYQDIQFGIGDGGDVLQMVQLGNLKQWVFEETCNGVSGEGTSNTICVERLRTINAVVVNVDAAVQISMESITVTCCATRSD